ncbi:hypothetical protein CDAR_582751 [Caerostris darwini]|uniref:C2H2-type domain-containing protein n=1 Tax=Caerostris darwini TaxID=1538125 RepID=A0AAV4PLH3_9ARAC|nr:hypothetical protein CDAR_582751 [Caerostris darwini]
MLEFMLLIFLSYVVIVEMVLEMYQVLNIIFLSIQEKNMCDFIKLCFICRTCGKWFSARSTLTRHRIWHHKSEFPEFKYNCKNCPYSTNESTNLKNHALVHSPDHPFVCDVCGNRFKALTSLNHHAVIHKGDVEWFLRVPNTLP